jgi:hypothetical protein
MNYVHIILCFFIILSLLFITIAFAGKIPVAGLASLIVTQ